jgi:hypothetical protein
MPAIRLLVLAAAALLASSVSAQTARAPMTVSVTVARSCTVTTSAISADVTCGRHQPPMRVVEHAATPSTTPSASAAGARVVTIDF